MLYKNSLLTCDRGLSYETDDILVAFSEFGKFSVDQYQNIPLVNILAKLRCPASGTKDGAHFLRTALQTDNSGKCLSRKNEHTQSLARILIIDCDKSTNDKDNAPCPREIQKILKNKNLWHVIYGSYSYYEGNVRFRIILLTKVPYFKEQLSPTIQSVVDLINNSLHNNFLINANENSVWAQPWYLGRKSISSKINDLFLEHLTGDLINIINPEIPPPIKEKKLSEKNNPVLSTSFFNPSLEIPVITAFNEQFSLVTLFIQYGFKKCYSGIDPNTGQDFEKWLSPTSKTKSPGITYWPSQNKFYSHHSDILSNKKPHDAFDLMQHMENLRFNEAIKKAAKICRAPSGLTVDEHNKSLRAYRATTAR